MWLGAFAFLRTFCRVPVRAGALFVFPVGERSLGGARQRATSAGGDRLVACRHACDEADEVASTM